MKMQAGSNSTINLTLRAIAVFAHNEERFILNCLQSLPAAGCGPDIPVYVLINGCTDRSAEVVENYARTHKNIKPVVIQKGDKANAWNVFVHEYAPLDGAVIFMDGDVRTESHAIERLLVALDANPFALLASAVPGSGRNRAEQVRDVIQNRGVQGNLYAVRTDFLRRVRERGVRMPVGFVREDGLVGALVAWDLDPRNIKWDSQRIVPVAESRFLFDPIPLFSWRGLRTYWRRRIRYSVGHFENRMIREILRRDGAEKMPATVQQLYRCSARPTLTWRGINTLFDWLALRRIYSHLKT